MVAGQKILKSHFSRILGISGPKSPFWSLKLGTAPKQMLPMRLRSLLGLPGPCRCQSRNAPGAADATRDLSLSAKRWEGSKATDQAAGPGMACSSRKSTLWVAVKGRRGPTPDFWALERRRPLSHSQGMRQAPAAPPRPVPMLDIVAKALEGPHPMSHATRQNSCLLGGIPPQKRAIPQPNTAFRMRKWVSTCVVGGGRGWLVGVGAGSSPQPPKSAFLGDFRPFLANFHTKDHPQALGMA